MQDIGEELRIKKVGIQHLVALSREFYVQKRVLVHPLMFYFCNFILLVVFHFAYNWCLK